MLALLFITSIAGLVPNGSIGLRPLELSEAQIFQEEATRIDCLVEQTAALDLKTLLDGSTSWAPCDQDIPNYAYTTDAIWLRLPISLTPKLEEPWYLEIAWPHLDRVEVFLPTPQGTYQTIELGLEVPLDRREIVHRHMLVPIEHRLHYQEPVYIRIAPAISCSSPLRFNLATNSSPRNKLGKAF